MLHKRKINWLDSAVHQLRAQVPELGDDARYVAERMTVVFLERLAPLMGQRLVKMLPKGCITDLRPLTLSAGAETNHSIGYPEFVTAARSAVGVCESAKNAPLSAQLANDEIGEEFYRRVADAFLWGLAMEVPSDLKSSIAGMLPIELRSRMNLYSGTDDSARVA